MREVPAQGSGAPAAPRRGRAWVSLACLAAIVAIIALTLAFAPRASDGESFGGTDSKATEMVEADGGKPWFHPLWEPGSSEVESGLFALQAAAGAGIFGYVVGRLHERRRARPAAEAPATPQLPPTPPAEAR